MSCRNNRSEILALRLVTWLPPSLAMQLHSSKQIISWQRLENGVEMSFLQDTASQVSPVGDKLEVGEMGHPNTLCFGSFNSRRRIQVIIRQPSPQWLSCRMFVTRSAKRGYCQKKTPQTALSVYFPGTKNLQVRVVDAITLPGARVQQPLTPFQWRLFQQVPLNPRDTSAMVYD